MPLPAGSRLGPYEILEPLGAGGTVKYIGRHPNIYTIYEVNLGASVSRNSDCTRLFTPERHG